MVKWIRIGNRWINAGMLSQIKVQITREEQKIAFTGPEEFYISYRIPVENIEVVKDMLDRFFIEDDWHLLDLSSYVKEV